MNSNVNTSMIKSILPLKNWKVIAKSYVPPPVFTALRQKHLELVK